jgi:hypothetical protein
MEFSRRFEETRDQLDYVADMLAMLGVMISGVGSPLLVYFIRLAEAQARDECNDVTRQTWGESAFLSGPYLH